jgi:transcriptional regulator with XRE-family HTH domain
MKIITEPSKARTNPVADLFASPLSVEEEAEYKKLMIAEELLLLMKEQGISRSQLAERMGVGPSRVTAMMTGSNNFTIDTLVRAGRAVGAELHQHFVPQHKQAHWAVYDECETHEAFRAPMKPARNPSTFQIAPTAKEDNATAA